MTDTYVECLVKSRPKAIMKFLKYLAITVTVLLGLASVAIQSAIGIILTFAVGVAAYFVSMGAEIEYEYLYCDKEITVDKIMNQTKRKRVAVYDVNKMEILAPINSYQLDNYKSRECKEIDYSSREKNEPDLRYVFYYDGTQKVIIEPSEKFVKAIYNVAPRKVFTN